MSRASTSARPAPAPTLALLADPPARHVDACAMDYLLIEAVRALRASAAVAAARRARVEAEMAAAGLLPRALDKGERREGRESVGSAVGGGEGKGLSEEEEAVRGRLEAIGMHVGANFSERLCRDKPLFTETLDAIKFVCKDIWAACWEKQVDNLRTNHRVRLPPPPLPLLPFFPIRAMLMDVDGQGVYVLQDNAFKPLARLSSWDGRADALHKAKLYVALPAGIIRGALARLGLQGTVVPEVTTLPQCTFQVKLPKNT
ncbi:hypothetical protein HWV62_835 [Athelia sp. TMB]|nr:hypothetical protein HWV62_835 [Athelia sp. TMB]